MILTTSVKGQIDVQTAHANPKTITLMVSYYHYHKEFTIQQADNTVKVLWMSLRDVTEQTESMLWEIEYEFGISAEEAKRLCKAIAAWKVL